MRFVWCVVVVHRAERFFIIMIKEDKIKRELEKLYEYRRQALKRNDLMWMVRNNAKIKEKEAEASLIIALI